jgi:hypothetical protein
MRNRIAGIAMSLLGAAALVLAITTPASAASGKICQFNGSFDCVGSPDLNYGTSMTAETNLNGRNITFSQPVGAQGVISLNGGTDKCIKTVSNELNLVIGHCNDTGVSWFQTVNSDGSRYWHNVHTGYYMACDNHVNDVCVARPLGATGWFYKMSPIG